MNALLSIGLILLAALIAGHLAQRIRLPEVTGYLVMGALIGPAALDVVTHDNLEALQLLSEVALGLILFSIGTIFEAGTFRAIGPRVAAITAAETAGAFVLVVTAMLLLGLPGAVAVLLGVIAMETAPATTLMVIREYDSSGPLTDSLLALLAINNMIVLVTFGLVSAMLMLVTGSGASAYASAHAIVWGIFGSIALGVLAGLLLDAWARRVKEPGELMTLSIGTVLLTVGAARALGLSPLVASLAVGATIANAPAQTELLAAQLRRTDPPLYAAFFVLAGAELPVALLPQIGITGLAYAVMRSIGKIGGTWAAVRRMPLPVPVRRQLGWCLLSSSSLAIGLTIQVRHQFPAIAGQVTAVVLAAVIVFEIVGPILARSALIRAGEVPRESQPLVS